MCACGKRRLTRIYRPCNIPDYFLVHAPFSEVLQILQAIRGQGATTFTTSLFGLGVTFSHAQTERTLCCSMAYCIGSVMLSIEHL